MHEGLSMEVLCIGDLSMGDMYMGVCPSGLYFVGNSLWVLSHKLCLCT